MSESNYYNLRNRNIVKNFNDGLTEDEDDDNYDDGDEQDVIDDELVDDHHPHRRLHEELRNMNERNWINDNNDYDNHEDDQVNESRNTNSKSIYFLLLIICLLAGIFVKFSYEDIVNKMNAMMNTPNGEKYSDEKQYEIFMNILETELKPKYNKIMTNINWLNIETGIKEKFNFYNENLKIEKEPIIYLFLSSIDNQKLTRQLMNDLQIAISKSYPENMIKESKIIKENVKYLNGTELNMKIKTLFDNNKLHTINIEGINEISGSDILSLHCFTDHENALFVDVFIILSAYSNQSFISKEISNYDQLANDLLLRSWITSSDENQIGAMLSRLTSRVIIIMDQLS